VPAFILSLGTGIAAPALPIFAKSFGVSFGVASLVLIAYSVGELLSTLPTGYLVDRIGRRKIVLAGPLITALASFLAATARSFPQLLAYRFLGGWATQMWMLGRLVVIADTSRPQQRGRQITGMVGVQRAGLLMGPVVGGLMAAAWGIRLPFLLHGVLAVLSVVPSFTLLRESAPAKAAPTAPGARSARASGSLAAMLVFPVLALLVAQFFTNMTRGALQGSGGSLCLYATYAYGSGPATLGILGTAGAVLGIPITLTAGYIMDRYGRKATIVPG
jgi:MFS family permease